jgi:hypothetical protein
MNERIKELAKQAGFHIELNWDHTDWHSAGHSPLFEKFAELIIRECMACSTWVGKMNTNSSEPIQTAHAINQRIKQHFGVEE